ncbi:glycosyltransferase family 4 protein [SAR202 cluster bacterium AD-804-J14_MRT_500m]|nr:glycosyltransferase family 4 protein [SAR202 cluster bacterium AD-804-J14_MRT_500m]
MTVSIVTTQNFGMDRYSQEIAQRSRGPVFSVDRYNSSPGQMWEVVDALKEFCQPVHYPNQHFGWYAFSAGLPYIMTVHDLERITMSFPRENVDEQRKLRMDAAAIQKAHHVIAVSHATKRDIVRHLNVPKDRVSVVHNGVDHSVFHMREPIHQEFPFILYVGSERPRKNLRRLLAAFSQAKKDADIASLKLVKIGGPGRSLEFREDTLSAITEFGLTGEVIFLENVDDDLLASYYASAKALVYASLYEGFGFPLVEAMATGCPVITSRYGAQSEISGNAGYLVDPLDTNELSRAIVDVVSDGNLGRKLTLKGLKQSKKYCWNDAARETVKIFKLVEAKVEKENDIIKLCEEESSFARDHDSQILLETGLLANSGRG